MLLYLHGFNSSPASYKATQLQSFMAAQHPDIRLEIPYLKPYPQQSISQLHNIIDKAQAAGETVTLMGSSLGGYYATWLAQQYGLRAVLINPSVRPFELLSRYLGENKNFYNDDHYLFEQKHVDELRQFYVPHLSQPENICLFVQSGDETLDFKEATAKYSPCRCIIEYGGDHGFQNFDRWFTYSLKFLHLIS